MIDEKNKTLDGILEIAMNSDAVNHAFLKRFREHDFQDMNRVTSVLSYNYYEYSKFFQRYLCALISKIEKSEHRVMLLDNLFEEAGNLHEEDIELLKEINIDPSWVDGIEHPTLFRNFLSKVEVNEEVAAGKKWARGFLNSIQACTELESLGMLSIGTESIVKFVYRDLLAGLRKTEKFTEQDLVFFTLHSEIDDEHSEIMLNILMELIEENPENIIEVEKGAKKALDLRTEFFDDILALLK